MTTVVEPVSVNTMLAGIRPMLAAPGDLPLEALRGGFVFDQKLDGIRAMAAWGRDGLSLRNRSGRDILINYADIQYGARGALRKPVILDGEIVAANGSFQDIARRDKQRSPLGIANAMQDTPAKFVAFDVLWHPDHGDVRGWRYIDRRGLLEGLNIHGPSWDTSLASLDPEFFAAIVAMGGEGVVAKRLHGHYRSGRQSDWLKYKNTHTLTCVAIGFEPGTGSRAFMGAVLLGLVDEDAAGAGPRVMQVGRVGSGFTQAEAVDMHQSLLAAQRGEQALPVIEVECLGLTQDGKLRQPVFKGVRTDLTIFDAVSGQLDPLPRA